MRVRDKLYVIADDELHLGVFGVDGEEPLKLVRLLDGDLPASAKKRKKLKPDFESLLLLPASDESPGGSLLALGSGSRAEPVRRRPGEPRRARRRARTRRGRSI